MARILPTEKDLIGYDYAVAGHEGTLSDTTGELFIKPCTPAEVVFYEETNAYHQDFAELMPVYLGTLELSENQEASLEDQGAALIEHSHADVYPLPKTRKIVTNRALVLENAAYGFKRPNILDVKLGVRLWADDAKEEKKIRFDKVTAESTHKDLGFRIAGMRVFQGESASADTDVQPDGYKIYDKNYGRFFVNNDNVADAFREFIFVESAGVDEELGRLIAEAFVSELLEVQKVLEGQESRMYSASLLFVFEGDGEALRFAMEEASKTPPPQTNGVNTVQATNGEGFENEDEEEEEEDDDEVDTRPKIFSLKVIDFAHAQWTPGQGPDENALKGVRSVIRILKDLGSSA